MSKKDVAKSTEPKRRKNLFARLPSLRKKGEGNGVSPLEHGRRLKKKIFNGAHDLVFKKIHGGNLVYNTCWEDPRLDRQVLDIQPDSKVAMLTSAGCNALDYLLDQPAAIHCVDMNPRQNSLLQLKLRMIETLHYEDFFALFGKGHHKSYKEIYEKIRPELPEYAQDFWDRKIGYFSRKSFKKSFYYRGTSGSVAWLLRHYVMQPNRKLRTSVLELLEAPDLPAQKKIYEKIEPELSRALVKWLLKHPVLLAMVGVPRPQIQLIDDEHTEGVWGYVRDLFRHMCTEVPMADNYFWRVYIHGCYTPQCCPNYLKRDHFETLRPLAKRVHTYNSTLAQFLQENPDTYTQYILLDHQDWLAWNNVEALREEWELILKNSRPGTKIILRSAGTTIDFIPDFAKRALRFHPAITDELHKKDRVGTYGSFHYAEVL